MPRVLVIAAAGFVGRAVVQALARRPCELVTAARHGADVACDVTDAAQVDAAIRTAAPDAVVNCSGAPHDGPAADLYAVHALGTLHLLEAVRRHAAAAPVVLIGSAAEYGPAAPQELPVREDHPCRPAGVYGCSKLAQAQLARLAQDSWGLRVRTVRLFNAVGPGMPGRYFFPALAARLRGREPGGTFPLRDGDSTRDFVHVDDVGEAVALLVDGALPDGVFNVATGVETSVREAAAHLGLLAGGLKPVDDGPAGPASRSAGDATRLQSLGWQPRRTWRQAIEDIWADR
jgi:nucleoside-diphosphate-sugar epimerase